MKTSGSGRHGICGTFALGRVSRASPVQTAMRNCTRDEGRSFEAGSQVLASNHCKLLSSKAMVVSVAVNVGRISRRVRLREASASEPSMNCRKRIRRCQNRFGHNTMIPHHMGANPPNPFPGNPDGCGWGVEDEIGRLCLLVSYSGGDRVDD